jgi:hypothetical protein
MTTTVLANYRWQDLNGSIYCYQHLGCQAQACVDHNPDATEFTTPLTGWLRLEEDEIADFVDFLASRNLGTESCEACRERWGR